MADKIRIGNAERDRAAELLGEHFRAGRLNVVEFDERVAAAYAAKTDDDLHPLFTDLPKPASAKPLPRPQGLGSGRMPQRRRSVPMGLLRIALLAFLGVIVVGVVIGMLPFILVGTLLWLKFSGRLCGGPRWRHEHHYRSSSRRSWA